ncbi:MAG: hypothetical protein ACRDND_25935 [Streptosporangiaceae bacterium]
MTRAARMARGASTTRNPVVNPPVTSSSSLARTAKARAVLQTAFYSRLLAELQGTEPRWMHLALGNGEFVPFKGPPDLHCPPPSSSAMTSSCDRAPGHPAAGR